MAGAVSRREGTAKPGRRRACCLLVSLPYCNHPSDPRTKGATLILRRDLWGDDVVETPPLPAFGRTARSRGAWSFLPPHLSPIPRRSARVAKYVYF